jgi:uncharacterized protein
MPLLLKRYSFYTIIISMDFELDPAKSAANKAKHGIDFEAAQVLWSDVDLAVAPTLAGPEPRFLAIGKIDEKVWTAVFSWRGDRLRIISARRARPNEVRHYEEDQL